MRDRYTGAVHNGTTQNGQPDRGRNELVLQPGILEFFIILYLVDVEPVEIFALVIIFHNGTSTPLGTASSSSRKGTIGRRRVSGRRSGGASRSSVRESTPGRSCATNAWTRMPFRSGSAISRDETGVYRIYPRDLSRSRSSFEKPLEGPAGSADDATTAPSVDP